MTHYHAKYWAHALSLKSASNSIVNLSRSIANAKVDLNPHQVHAALFALQSPLSRGVILADEVGLGKTIEAGLVIAQLWAERKRRVLLITPAFLRKQWESELIEKFTLPCRILDSKAGGFETLSNETEEIIICSYQFAAQNAHHLSQKWDLAVIDEAHRMRNVYKSSNKHARQITDALANSRKLLLTATPLQNNLMELYGLVSVIDPYVFGDESSFKEQFVCSRTTDDARDRNLRKRLESLIVRTLRKQVQEYIPFTKRIAITQNFTPNDDEQSLYEGVSAYLQRKDLIALPNSQRQLITLVLRKLLSSSSFAITHTLQAMIDRLDKAAGPTSLVEELGSEYFEALDEELKEQLLISQPTPEVIANREKIKQEASELRGYLDLAQSIQKNSKGESLLLALDKALTKAQELGATRKAVIFTESTRTQTYLYELLSQNGYQGQIVRINGSNNDEGSTKIYKEWVGSTAEAKRTSRAVDMKAALVQYFRDKATILLATEAAAEGVNLQFASLIVNFDLPWNPQRIEQRIGRCHRYGQKHDVVVVNFVNTRNEADKRVFELLNEKFKLFDGVFGASDEVLGAIESGVDIEMRIHNVYQTCRTPEEIRTAFDLLRQELDEQIQENLKKTRENILNHLDQEVTALLKAYDNDTREALSQREKWLFHLACHELDLPLTSHPCFFYEGVQYHMNWRHVEEKNGIFFREEDPFAVQLIHQAKTRVLPTSHVIFDYSGYSEKVSVLEKLVGKSGWLQIYNFSVNTFEFVQTLLFVAMTDDGEIIVPETAEKLFLLSGTSNSEADETQIPSFEELRIKQQDKCLQSAEVRAAEIFDNEVDKLDAWSEDRKLGLETEIKGLDKEIKTERKKTTLSKTLAEKLESIKRIRTLESQRSAKRHSLWEEQDRIDHERDDLVFNHEKRLQPSLSVEPLFTIRWSVI